MPIPWGVILRQAPMLLGAAEALLASSHRRAAAGGAIDAEGLRQQLEAIDADLQANAELVKDLSEQVAALAEAAEASAARARLAVLLGVAAVTLAGLACVIALFA